MAINPVDGSVNREYQETPAEQVDEAEALRVANDTIFGLGATVLTRGLDRGTCIAREELEARACFVNAFVRPDPRLPFGGIKESGYGRELSPVETFSHPYASYPYNQ